VLFTFHPISGKPDIGRPSALERVDRDVISVIMLAQTDDQYLRPLLMLDTQKQVQPQGQHWQPIREPFKLTSPAQHALRG